MEQLIKELEDASQVLLAPPNLVSSEQRHCAESVFLNFQKTKTPYDMCQFILANSTSSYVHFQAATLLKQAVIREWVFLEKTFIAQLRNGLMNFLIVKNKEIENFVREQLLLAVSIMVKRFSIEEGYECLSQYMTEVSSLISSGDSALQTIGCSALATLLNEFASSTRATDIGLTWETHLRAKKKFEQTELKRLFEFCLKGLSELNKISAPLSDDTAKLLQKFILIAEQVLTWNFQFAMFLPRKLVGMFEAQQNPTLRPSGEWRSIILDPNVLQLFFKLHWQVRDYPDICHHTLQCIHQFSSLNGSIVNEKNDKVSYARCFVENLLQLLASGALKQYEVIGISNVLHRLHIFFSDVFYEGFPLELLQTYLRKITELTCYLLEKAVVEENTSEDSPYMEAFDHVLDAWSAILQEAQIRAETKDIIRQSSIEIFNHYLKAHLAAPEGSRPQDNSDTVEITEIEEDDRTKFWDQLMVIGTFGRFVLDHTVPLLVRLLEYRISILHEHLQQIHQLAGKPLDFSVTSVLNALNEDLHWLVVITGHLLSCGREGDISLMPIEIIMYSQSRIESVNMATTIQLITSPTHRTCDIPGAEENADQVVRLIAAIFRLCEFEKRAAEANLLHLLSPELAESLVWFIGRFSSAYLMPNESYYAELSLVLTQVFGKDSEPSLWTLNFLLGKLESNFGIWMSEAKLVNETAHALTTILNNTERGDKAIQCTSLATIVKNQAAGNYQSLPTAAKRSILKSLVIVGTANKDDEIREKYWKELLQPLQERYQTVLLHPEVIHRQLQKRAHLEIMDLLESMMGVVDGCVMSNVTDIMPFFNPLFQSLVKLVEHYHNENEMVNLVFQMYSLATKRVLPLISQENANVLYDSCLKTIHIYTKHNQGRFNKDSSAEEEKYQDLILLLQLLTEMNFKDFCDTTIVGENGAESQMSGGQVSMMGLSMILPMINIELLTVPSLSVQFYKLAIAVIEFRPSKICEFPANLLGDFFSLIQYGLTSYSSVNSILCLDFISVISLYLCKNQLLNNHVHAALEPFLKTILEMLLFHPLESEQTQVASMTLHSLVCCFNEKYEQLVQELIRSQQDQATAQRLITCFTKLSSSVTFNSERQSRFQFRDEFDKFITEVRGFLCIK